MCSRVVNASLKSPVIYTFAHSSTAQDSNPRIVLNDLQMSSRSQIFLLFIRRTPETFPNSVREEKGEQQEYRFGWHRLYFVSNNTIQESRAVARKPRDAAAGLFGLKFADNIHYKFEGSHASKANLQSSKRTGAKQNLAQKGHSRSFKVTCFEVSGKAIKD